ncbi:hypothetical protein ACFVTD_14975, partial [Pseudarthrobacter sp. NPDC058119]
LQIGYPLEKCRPDGGMTLISGTRFPTNREEPPKVDALHLGGAVIGAALGAVIFVRTTLREGRHRREYFVWTGGDPTGITDMMFGVMRGETERKRATGLPPSKVAAITKAFDGVGIRPSRVLAQLLLLPCFKRR